MCSPGVSRMPCAATDALERKLARDAAAADARTCRFDD
eukprot:gene31193-22655_t